MKDDNRLRFSDIKTYVGFGVGALGLDLSYGLFYTFLSKYLTDVLQVSLIFLMILAFAARIWDGINDPLMGSIVDHTRSRQGKNRAWILPGAVLNAIILCLLFWNPGFSVGKNPGLYVYIAIMYVLWGMTNTMVDIPYWSMVPSLTDNPNKRNFAATIARTFSGLGNMIIAVATPILIGKLGRVDGLNALGFHRWSVICSVALLVFVLLSFVSTANVQTLRNAKPSAVKFSFKAMFNTVRGNRPLLIFMLTALLCNIGWYSVSGLSAYYFQNVAGDLSLMSKFSILVGAGQAVGLLVIPVLSKKMKRNNIIALTMLMAAVGYIGMFVFSQLINVFPLFALFGFIGMMGVGSCFVGQTIMLSDCVDYGEYLQGFRSESVIFSMKGLQQKCAYSVQALIMYFGLFVSRYKGFLSTQNMQQPNSAKQAIVIMMLILPAVFVLTGLFVFKKYYKLDAKTMEDVTAARHEKQLANAQQAES